MSCCRSSAVDWSTHDADCIYGGHQSRVVSTQLPPSADHGVSPAQLLAQLEALHTAHLRLLLACEKDAERIEKLEKVACTQLGKASGELHVALKRIEVLDAQLSAALVSISALNQGLLRIEELEKWSHSHTTIGHVDLTVHKTLKAKP